MHNLKHLKQERSIFKMILILGSIISSCIVAAKDVATTNFPHQNDVNAQFLVWIWG